MTIFSEQQGQALVRLARMAILAKLDPQNTADGEAFLRKLVEPIFQKRLGVFVTLTSQGRLRGCIGNLVASSTVLEGVKCNALNAAFNDSRFPPLTANEFGEIGVEVSVLTSPMSLHFIDSGDLAARLRPGVDGVILRKGAASATFLPQVWEQLPSVEEFLCHLCLKAGLTSDAWHSADITVETYQVEHFSG